MPDRLGKVVKTLQPKDPTVRVLIIERPDRRYAIRPERLWPPVELADRPSIPAYWHPTSDHSGIYATIEIAELEAYAEYPWLRPA